MAVVYSPVAHISINKMVSLVGRSALVKEKRKRKRTKGQAARGVELTEWPVVVGVALQYLVVGDEPSDRGHDGYDAEAQERIDGHASAMVDLKFPYDWKGEEKDFPREKSANKKTKEKKRIKKNN